MKLLYKIKQHQPKSQAEQVKSGFTLVELMITMAFISVLLITIAIITSNIVTIYQKGTTLKAVNSVGRGLIDEFTNSINASPSVDTTSLCTSLADADDTSTQRCKDAHAFDYIYHAQYSEPDADGRRYQYNGIFCTGYYSYLWNTYYGIDEEHTIAAKYLTGPSAAPVTTDGEGEDAARLLRFEDRNYRLCSAVMGSDYVSHYNDFNGTTNPIDITTLAHSTIDQPLYNYTPNPQDDMLSEFDLDLMLYELTIFPISQDSITLRTYMSGTFILATTRGTIDIMRSGDYCDLGNYGEVTSTGLMNLGAEFNYCAINKFNFAARTAGV